MVEHHTATRICKGMSRRVVCSYAQVRALSTALKHFDCPRVVMTAFGNYQVIKWKVKFLHDSWTIIVPANPNTVIGSD